MKRFLLGVVVLVLTASVSFAESDRKELVVFPGDFIAAHVADGGGWSTTFVLVNLGGEEHAGTLYFAQDGGVPLVMDFEEFGMRTSLDFTLAPRGTFTAKTQGTAAEVSTGFALMIPDNATTDEIGGSAIFGYSVPGVITLESAVPFGNILYKKNTLFFDHRNGYATGVALVNPAPTTAATVTLDFYRQDGSQLMTEQLSMKALGHTSFMFSDNYPELEGQVGSVEISTDADATAGILVLGLRANPTGPFTTLFPMITLSDLLDSLE